MRYIATVEWSVDTPTKNAFCSTLSIAAMWSTSNNIRQWPTGLFDIWISEKFVKKVDKNKIIQFTGQQQIIPPCLIYWILFQWRFDNNHEMGIHFLQYLETEKST